MGISYKSLLPKRMQSARWGELIDAFQYIMDTIVSAKVTPIKTRFDILLMTKDEIVDMSYRLGFPITYLDGYTSSNMYLLKQIASIIKRVLTKTTRTGYKYIYQIYNINGDIYPIFINFLTSLWDVQDTYWTKLPSRTTTQILDESPLLTLDTGLILDNNISSVTTPIRHFVLSYYNKNIEDSTQFLSVNTLQAFYTDVRRMKRTTEIPYFEPNININIPVNQTGIIHTTTWKDYNGISYNNQSSIMFKPNLSGITSMQLGNGQHTNLITATGSVQSRTYTITNNVSGLQTIGSYTPITFTARKRVTEKFKFMDSSSGQLYFTEVGLMNSSGQCIVYSTFPKIQWYPYMYQNILVDINLI